MTRLLTQFAAMALLSLVAACGTPNVQDAPHVASVPGYEAIEDAGFEIPAVDPRLLTDGYQKAEVSYTGNEAPGTIVVDTFARKLYYVEADGMATRYGIAVGREGLSFRGSGVVGRKEKWPSWQPTRNMIRTRPDLYLEFAGGMSGGLDNPLGARAMYLYRGGRDTYFRIHGTIDNNSIGHATSAGCIRLSPKNAAELFYKVRNTLKGHVPVLAMNDKGSTDRWGRVRHDDHGSMLMQDGYRAVLFVENYDGREEISGPVVAYTN